MIRNLNPGTPLPRPTILWCNYKYLLIYNQYKRICNSNSNLISERLSDLYFASFCNAMSANKLTLDLNISLMREDDNYDEEYLSLLSEIMYSDELKVENLNEFPGH